MKRMVMALLTIAMATSLAAAGKPDSIISRVKAVAAAKAFMKSQNYSPARYEFHASKSVLTVDSLLKVGPYKSFNYRRAKSVQKSVKYPFFWRVAVEGKDPGRDGIFEVLIDAKSGKMVYYDPLM